MEKDLISIFKPESIVSSPECLYDGNFKGKATRMLKIKYKRSIFRCFPWFLQTYIKICDFYARLIKKTRPPTIFVNKRSRLPALGA